MGIQLRGLPSGFSVGEAAFRIGRRLAEHAAKIHPEWVHAQLAPPQVPHIQLDEASIQAGWVPCYTSWGWFPQYDTAREDWASRTLDPKVTLPWTQLYKEAEALVGHHQGLEQALKELQTLGWAFCQPHHVAMLDGWGATPLAVALYAHWSKQVDQLPVGQSTVDLPQTKS